MAAVGADRFHFVSEGLSHVQGSDKVPNLSLSISFFPFFSLILSSRQLPLLNVTIGEAFREAARKYGDKMYVACPHQGVCVCEDHEIIKICVKDREPYFLISHTHTFTLSHTHAYYTLAHIHTHTHTLIHLQASI